MTFERTRNMVTNVKNLGQSSENILTLLLSLALDLWSLSSESFSTLNSKNSYLVNAQSGAKKTEPVGRINN